MNEDLSQALAAQLRAAHEDVDVFLALEALSRADPAVACEAITGFIRSAPARHLPLACNALRLLAERAPALLVAATLDADAAVADAATQALLNRPSNAALPLYLRMAKSKSVDEVASGLMFLGRISAPEVRAPLFKALAHRSATVRAYAADSIRTRADDGWVPELLEVIGRLRREESEKKKDFSEVIDTLCGTVVAKAGKANLELLIQGLGDDDARVRRTCAGALGQLRDEAAVLPLIDTFEHPRRGMPQALRMALVEALGQLGDARAIAPLLQAGIAVAAPALGRLNAQEAVPDLVDALAQARTPRDAGDIAEVLAPLAGPGERQWPRAGLPSASLQVRRAAALQLVHTAPDEAVPHLCGMLAQLPAGDAVGVAKALAALGRAEGFEGFAQALADDPHHWNASAVASACESLRGPKVQALLLGLLPGIRNEYVHNVCKALAAQGAEVLPALIGAAQAAGDDVRHRYVLALSEFRDPAGAGLLAPLLVRGNPLQHGAMLSLAATPSPETSAALGAALQQADAPADVCLIVETLAAAATREAIPDLLRALQAGTATEEVLDALARLADTAALPALVEQLASPDAQRRQGAAAALAQIADPAAARPLFDLLLEEDDLQVAQAAMAAWLAVATAGGDAGAPGTPGTRAFLLASAGQLNAAARPSRP